MNKKTQTNTRYWLSVVAFGIVLGTGLQFAKAWTEPGATPPGGNVSGPLTTSDVGQQKGAGLLLNAKWDISKWIACSQWECWYRDVISSSTFAV